MRLGPGAAASGNVGIFHAIELAMKPEDEAMQFQVIEVSTEVFHLLQRHAPRLVEWAEEKAGPTQKVLLPAAAYFTLIDRAIANRQSLDQVVRDAYVQPGAEAAPRKSNRRRHRRANAISRRTAGESINGFADGGIVTYPGALVR